MATGKIKWFNAKKGYGYIAVDGGGPDVFVHHRALFTSGYRLLKAGQPVEFEVSRVADPLQVETIRVVGGPLEGPGAGGGDDRPPPRTSS